jgi:hypothetical protein
MAVPVARARFMKFKDSSVFLRLPIRNPAERDATGVSRNHHLAPILYARRRSVNRNAIGARIEPTGFESPAEIGPDFTHDSSLAPKHNTNAARPVGAEQVHCGDVPINGASMSCIVERTKNLRLAIRQ